MNEVMGACTLIAIGTLLPPATVFEPPPPPAAQPRPPELLRAGILSIYADGSRCTCKSSQVKARSQVKSDSTVQLKTHADRSQHAWTTGTCQAQAQGGYSSVKSIKSKSSQDSSQVMSIPSHVHPREGSACSLLGRMRTTP